MPGADQAQPVSLKWKVAKDINQPSLVNPYRYIIYENTQYDVLNSHLKTLKLYIYSDGNYYILGNYPSKKLHDECLQINFAQDHPKNLLEVNNTKDKKKLTQFVELLDQYEALDNIQIEFCNHLGIAIAINPEEEIAQAVSLLTENGQFNDAIIKARKAQLDGYYVVIWELANALHLDLKFEKKRLVELYESISEENPHYKEANDRLISCYSKDFFSNVDDPYYFLERQLDAALKANDNDDHQSLIDQLFHQLCGYAGMTPIRGMKGDINTLTSLAKREREKNDKMKEQDIKLENLNKKNLELQNENTRLKQEIAALKKIGTDRSPQSTLTIFGQQKRNPQLPSVQFNRPHSKSF